MILDSPFQLIRMCLIKLSGCFKYTSVFLLFFFLPNFSGGATQLENGQAEGTVLTLSTIYANAPHDSGYNDFLQETPWTCGPAALRFVLAHYGIETTEAELAKLSETQTNLGTTLLGLKKSAESFGINVKGQQWNWARLTQERDPAIAYISDSHYVVILESDAKTVTFFDPGFGESTYTKADFLKIWSGIILAFPPQRLKTTLSSYPLASSIIQQKFTLPLSLKKAVEMALANGTATKTAEERLRLGQAQLDSVLSNYTPKTELVFSTNKTLDEVKNTANNDNSLPEKAFSTTTQNTHKAKYQWKMDKLVSSKLGGKLSTTIDIGVSVNDSSSLSKSEKQYSLGPAISIDYLQPLTKDGRVAGYSPLSKSLNTWRVVQIQHDLDKQDIIFEVIRSYYNFVKAVQLVKFTEENLKQTQKQLETAKIQFKLGNLAEIEVSKMEVQLSRDQSNLIDTKKNHESLQEQLAILIGQPDLKHIDPTQTINYNPVDIRQNDMINKALEERKELKHLFYARENLNLDLSSMKSTDDSFLSLNASYQRKGEQRSVDAALDNIKQDSWRIEATLTIPLDDKGTTKSQTAQILSQLFDLSISIKKTKDQIVFEVNEAIRNLQSSKIRYEILEKTLKLAKENLAIDELRFSRGVIASDDLQRTQLELLQLKVDRFSALADYKLSEIELTKAVGVLGTESL